MTLSRRRFGRLAAGAMGAPAMAAAGLRFAICNETFVGAGFAEGCRIARRSGFAGLEIAPFTLGDDPAALPASRRREFRAIMTTEGTQYAGLHAFLSAPKGLHLTGPDAATRRQSWDYFRKMIDLCADLGEGAVMVFGSSRQRAAVKGVSVADATARVRQGLAELAPHAEARNVKVLLEPLAPHLCNVVTTLEQAVSIVREIGSPAIESIFDTHNAVQEKVPHPELIRKYYHHIFHVHLNEMDGRHPGAADYDFRAVLQTLKDLDYRRWVSVEVFDFAPGGEKIAHDSFAFLSRLESELR